MTFDHRKTAINITVVIMLLTMLMLIMPAHTFAASGAEGKAQINASTGVNLRKSASMKGEKIAVLPDDTELTILKEVYKSKTSTKKQKVWYKVKANGMTGFVRADNVDNVSYPVVSATVKKKAAFRKGPGIKMKKKGTLKKGTEITVLIDADPVKSTKGSSKTWYRISVNGKKGYICSKNVKLGNVVSTAAAPANENNSNTVKTSYTPNEFSKMTSEQFEAYLNQQGFPESYKPGLRALHAAHPNWVFTALQTGISWTDAMKKETKYKVSLVSKSYPTSYRSTSKDSFSSYSMVAVNNNASGAAVGISDEVSFEEVKSAVEKSESVTGTVMPESTTVLDSINSDAAVMTNLEQGSTVTIKAAVTNKESSQKWYEIEIITEKTSDGAEPVYADADSSADNDLDAANDAAEKAMLESDEEDDDESSEEDTEDAEEIDGTDEEMEGSLPVVIKGYVKADQIEVVLNSSVTDEGDMDDDEPEENSDQGTADGGVAGPSSEELTEDEKIAQNIIIASDTSAFDSDAENILNGENDGLKHETSGEAKNAYYQVEKGWYNANAYVVAYFMDPRNFLNEDRIYMFEDLSYRSEYQTAAAVEKIIAPTSLKKYGFTTEIFMNAGKKYNISPVFLAARVVQETGGSSASVNGTKSGGTVVYNPFNIGASGKNAVSKGLAYAKKKGWTTPEKAVNGAASYIASGYINKKQNTVYFQKFNVANGLSKVGTNQYMTNVSAPYSEAFITKKSYTKMGITSEPLAFVIPVFTGMLEKTQLP